MLWSVARVDCPQRHVAHRDLVTVVESLALEAVLPLGIPLVGEPRLAAAASSLEPER